MSEGVSILFVIVLTALQAASLQPAASAASHLPAAKAAYAAAAYEDALALLATPEAADDATEVLQYRALCLIALARPAEAQQTIERLVSQTPLYRVNDADTPPRLVTIFHAARQRLLPSLAKDMYVRAKTTFDEQDFGGAAKQFKELAVLLRDPDMPAQTSGVADLKTLGEGFLRLAEAQSGTRATAPDIGPDAESDSPPAAPSGGPLGNPGAIKMVFTEDDKDVRPPVELARKMPEWVPPNDAAGRREYRGVLEVLIDEHGAVAAALIRESVSDFYDAALVKSAREWRYKPAMRNGQAVKYRKVIGISLQPGGGTGD